MPAMMDQKFKVTRPWIGNPSYIGQSQGFNILGAQPSMVGGIYHICTLHTYHIVIVTWHYLHSFLCVLKSPRWELHNSFAFRCVYRQAHCYWSGIMVQTLFLLINRSFQMLIVCLLFTIVVFPSIRYRFFRHAFDWLCVLHYHAVYR